VFYLLFQFYWIYESKDEKTRKNAQLNEPSQALSFGKQLLAMTADIK